MIRIWFAALLLPIPALSQGLGLKDYIGRMPTAPGTTIEQKVEILSHIAWSRLQPENSVHPGHLSRAFSGHSPEDNLHWRSPDIPYDPFAGHGIDNQWARPDPASDYSTRHGFNPWSSPILSPRPFEGHRIENDFSAPGFNTASPWNDHWGRDQ